MMTDHHEFDVRVSVQRELGHQRSTAPGVLRAWAPEDRSTIHLKEVIVIIRPQRWLETKQRVQRLRLHAFTQHRVLGRGRERGLRYLPRQGAHAGVGVHYLPKRMVTWIVEESQVDSLVQAIIEANRTGQLGDGKIFVLPVGDAVRIRTSERGVDALRTEGPFELLRGVPMTSEMADASRH